MASASEVVGPECMKCGINCSMLLSEVSNLPQLESISNEIILELAHFKNNHWQCRYKDLYRWIKELFGTKWPEQAPSQQAVVQSIKKLSAHLSMLKKCPTSSIEREGKILNYFQCAYVLPQLGLHVGQAVCCLTKQPSKQEKLLKQKMYSVTRNANKRIKRKEITINKQKTCIESQHKMIKTYEKKLQGAETKLLESRAKLNRVNHRSLYWRAKVDSAKQQNSAKKAALLEEIRLLKQEVSSLDSSNADLNEAMQSLLSCEEIATFEGGKYTDDIRTCVYELLSLNVGVRNIAPIIRCVLKNVAHKSVSRLPSHGLTCQMILESLTIAQAQLGERLGGKDLEFNTLQTDGTTKYGEHYSTYDVNTASDETTYTLGIRHVFSGSAMDTLETFKEILDDIDCVQKAMGNDVVSARIVKNTMSDRHSAEKLFNKFLQEYREELLPTVAENWDHMTIEEKEQLTRMNNFFVAYTMLSG